MSALDSCICAGRQKNWEGRGASPQGGSGLVVVAQSAAVAFAAVYIAGVAVFQAAVLEAARPQNADLTHVLSIDVRKMSTFLRQVGGTITVRARAPQVC